MTESNRSMAELPALLDERRRYEGWLAALEARRETTPGHVFDRVKADYEHRLSVVADRLAAHRHAIEEERTSLESRRSLLEAEEQLRRDERAELELRAHVGELSGDDADVAFRTVDDALGALTEERESLSSRIAELDGLLREDRGAPAPAASEPAAETQAPVEAAERSAAAETTAPSAQASPPAPSATTAALPETQSSAVARDIAPLPTSSTAPVEEAPGADVSAAEESSPSEAAADAPALTAAQAAQAAQAAHLHVPAPGPAPRTASGTFDELAFLSGIVGPESAKAAPPEEPRGSALDDVLGTAATGGRRSGEAPLASNVPGNTPIILRSSGSMEQSKTLKCTDCGAMNYPTEWYCERCGAELAAL